MGLLANAGTPLMWAPLGHLVFGNILIAIFETLAIVLIFRLAVFRVFGLAVAANFASFLIGLFGLGAIALGVQAWCMGVPPIFSLRLYIISLTVAAFALSFLVEWPILRFAVNKPRRTIARTLAITLSAQVISHAMLVPYYLSAGVNTIDQQALRRTADFAAQPDWWVYYIAPDGDQVRRIRADGSGDEMVSAISRSDQWITTRIEELDDGRLWMVREQFPPEGGHSFTVPLVELGDPDLLPPHAYQSERRYVVDLNPESRGHEVLYARVGDWAATGFIAEGAFGERHVAVELPYMAWDAHNATLLPGDQVIFQLGPQVVLYDLNTTDLAVLTMGRGPCVLPNAPQ